MYLFILITHKPGVRDGSTGGAGISTENIFYM